MSSNRINRPCKKGEKLRSEKFGGFERFDAVAGGGFCVRVVPRRLIASCLLCVCICLHVSFLLITSY